MAKAARLGIRMAGVRGKFGKGSGLGAEDIPFIFSSPPAGQAPSRLLLLPDSM